MKRTIAGVGMSWDDLESHFRSAARNGTLQFAAASLKGKVAQDYIDTLVRDAARYLRSNEYTTDPAMPIYLGSADAGVIPRPTVVGTEGDPRVVVDQADLEAARLSGKGINAVAEAAAEKLHKQPGGRGRFGHRFIASSLDDSPLREDGLVDRLLSLLKTSPFVLQTPHRAAHKAIETMGMTLTTYRSDEDRTVLKKAKPDADVIQVIQVDHDWAALFGASSTDGTGGEWHLPYDIQVFEFAISGAAVIAAINADPVVTSMSIGIRPPSMKSWITDRCGVRIAGDKWSLITNTDLPSKGDPEVNTNFDRLYDFILAQVRATSIMLEAEVAVTEPIRAPYKSNQLPKAGKLLPALSHHIVRLNRRARAAALPRGDAEPTRHHRLHFRRGHWRHYANHKTWISWMLVGDPDLGFVEKEYRT